MSNCISISNIQFASEPIASQGYIYQDHASYKHNPRLVNCFFHRSSTDDAQLSIEQLLLRLSTDQVLTRYRPSSVNVMAVEYYLDMPRSSKTLMQQLSLNPRHAKQEYKLTPKGQELREHVSQMITSTK